MQRSIDSSVANAEQVTPASRAEAGSGLSFNFPDTVLIPRGTVLCRIGHRVVEGIVVPDVDNFMSPWWISSSDFSKILALGQRDPSWAARVSLAIAEKWHADCQLQIRVSLAEPLYAWAGQGRAISASRSPRAVPVSDPRAYWFPDASITQLYIPGLKHMSRGRAGALWFTAFQQRQSFPLLVAGAQLNLQTGQCFVGKDALQPGRRTGSIR